MHFLCDNLITGLWIVFLLYWRIASINVKAIARHEPLSSGWRHHLPFGLGILLFVWPDHDDNFLFDLVAPRTSFGFWLAVALVIAGLGFAIWARLYLGRNWSGTVALKQNHELVQTGPYALARHPIYTGLLLAFIGTAIGQDEVRSLLGVLFILIAFRVRIALEERWMIELFPEAYPPYRARVRMVVPYLW